MAKHHEVTISATTGAILVTHYEILYENFRSNSNNNINARDYGFVVYYLTKGNGQAEVSEINTTPRVADETSTAQGVSPGLRHEQ